MFSKILHYFKLKYSKDREYYKIMDSIFGIFPNNIELYKLALIHRSASLALDDGSPINNERLEFLGDAIIEAIVSDFLFIEFPEEDEGFLTQLRSKIVSRKTLNHIAIEIGLDRFLIAQGGGHYIQKHLYGDAFEAMIGAIYLDLGYNYANRLLIDRILPEHIDLSQMTQTESDFKSRLIEWAQKNKYTIVFNTVPSPQHTMQSPHFHTVVIANSVELGTGEGSSKKEAEQIAASNTTQLIIADSTIFGLETIDSDAEVDI